MTQDGGDDGDDDDRQRANLAVAVVVILLVAGSIWLIKAYAASRDRMDCFLAGLHHCAPADDQTYR